MSELAQGHPHDAFFTPATLRLLVALDEGGSLGAAARAVGVSQPHVSRVVASLERHLGYPLLARSHRGSELTTAGLALVGQARAVLAEHERLGRLADALGTPGPRQLELAASRTIGEHLVPGWLGLQAASHPDTWVSFRFDNSANVARWVRSGEVPLGFVEDPTAPEGLASEELFSDSLAIITPPGHPWAGRSAAPKAGATSATDPAPRPVSADAARTVGPEELAATPLVEREPGSGTRGTLDAALPHRARPVAVLDSNAAIVAAVGAGLGPAVLSEIAVRRAVADGTVGLATWDGPPLRRPLLAIWRPGARVPREVRDFLELVRRATADRR